MTNDPTRTREVIWRGLDDDSRLDVVSVEFAAEGGFVATGTQSTNDYRARWDLIVDAAWRSHLLTVDVEGFDHQGEGIWQRHLNLWRQDSGGEGERISPWRAEGGSSGPVPDHFGDVGLSAEDAELLQGAVDVDLSGCPLTNTMPIQRLGLLGDASRESPLTMAWASLPDLAVRPAAQTYGPAEPGSVHYRSATRGVSVDLTLDEDGIVLTYPDLAERMTAPPGGSRASE